MSFGIEALQLHTWSAGPESVDELLSWRSSQHLPKHSSVRLILKVEMRSVPKLSRARDETQLSSIINCLPSWMGRPELELALMKRLSIGGKEHRASAPAGRA